MVLLSCDYTWHASYELLLWWIDGLFRASIQFHYKIGMRITFPWSNELYFCIYLRCFSLSCSEMFYRRSSRVFLLMFRSSSVQRIISVHWCSTTHWDSYQTSEYTEVRALQNHISITVIDIFTFMLGSLGQTCYY